MNKFFVKLLAVGLIILGNGNYTKVLAADASLYCKLGNLNYVEPNVTYDTTWQIISASKRDNDTKICKETIVCNSCLNNKIKIQIIKEPILNKAKVKNDNILIYKAIKSGKDYIATERSWTDNNGVKHKAFVNIKINVE